MTPSSDFARYVIGVAFATMVFAACWYGIVLYEYDLDDLKTGALISLMTLAANYVFAEAVARAAVRRSQQSYEAGKSASKEISKDDI